MASEIQVGDRVDRYVIRDKIGEGGMGVVYLAFHEALQRKVAIKFLHREMLTNEQATQRFLREARAAAAVDHPGITQVYDITVHRDGRPYIVMEYLDGESLGSRLARHGTLPTEDIIEIGIQTASALAAAHGRRVLHRDLKPDNIFLVAGEGEGPYQAKVLDFGLAKLGTDRLAGTNPNLSRDIVVMGTPQYMAPEQVRDTRDIDERSDIYALGCVLFQMACGRPPFTGDTLFESLSARLHHPAPDLRALAPDLPAPLAALIQSMLATAPGDRPQSMNEVVDALARIRDAVHAVSPGDERDTRPDPAPSEAELNWDIVSLPILRPGDDRPAVPTSEPGPEAFGADESRAASGPWAALGETLPPDMTESRADLEKFLGAAFESAERVADRVLRLRGPRILQADAYAFFAVFASPLDSVARAPLDRIGSDTFIHSARSLDAHLSGLDEGHKVVVAIASSAGLGPGVREKMLDYRVRFDAFVVPLYLGEVRRVCRTDTIDEFFRRRLADFHTLPDPYAPHGSTADATRFFGMRALLNDLVARIRDSGAVISITGLPGSGKSALVTMAEYGLSDLDFVYVRCPATPRRTPLELVKSIAAALPEPPEIEDGAPADRAFMVTSVLFGREQLDRLRTEAASEPGKRRILVLEDADWLIGGLAAPDTSAAEAEENQESEEIDELRAMWSALAAYCQDRGMTAVITSTRGFLLTQRVIGGWDNPVRPYAIEIGPLTERELGDMVRQLGVTIRFDFTDRAVREIHRLSAGNIYTARLLCSRIVRHRRERSDHSILEATEITRRDVLAAARQQASLVRTYDDTLMPWLDEAEQQTLHHVAVSPPRSAEAVQRALAGSLGETRAMRAFTVLQNMGLITARRRVLGRPWRRPCHQVSIPLVAEWLRSNRAQPSRHRRHLRQRRLRHLAIGMSLTAVMIAMYIAWFQTGRQVTETRGHARCDYEVDYPNRGAPDERLAVFVHRRCAAAPQKPWSLAAVSAPVRFEGRPDDGVYPMACDAGQLNCMAEIPIVLLESARDRYDFALSVDGREVSAFTVEKDALATVKRNFELVFQIAAILPLVLGLLLAFHGEVTGSVKRLFRSLAGRDSDELPA